MGLAPVTDLAPRLTGIPLAEIPVPNGREEEWRFTPLSKLSGLHSLDKAGGRVGFQISGPTGIEVAEQTLGDFPAADRAVAVAAQLSSEALAIHIPGDVDLSEPVLVNVSAAVPQAIGRLQINVGAGSRVTIVIDQSGDTAQSIAVGFDLGANSSVRVITVQDAGTSGVLLAQHAFALREHAALDYRSASLGGGLIRMHTTVDYLGAGGTAKLAGAFFTTDGQHHEHRLFVGHELPNCTSDVVYKGAIEGDDSHSVWVGDVLIRAGALGTKTYELNRNLLLTPGARADSVPNLEIETGQIQGAGHASATGRFDEEQLFYLMSRGIPAAEARRLVVRGFLAEVIDEINEPAMRNRIWQRIDSLLGSGDPLFELVHAHE